MIFQEDGIAADNSVHSQIKDGSFPYVTFLEVI